MNPTFSEKTENKPSQESRNSDILPTKNFQTSRSKQFVRNYLKTKTGSVGELHAIGKISLGEKNFGSKMIVKGYRGKKFRFFVGSFAGMPF